MNNKITPHALLLFVLLVVLGCNSEQSKETVEKVDTTHSTEAKTSEHHAHWAYEGEDGPDHWATLSPAYALCGQGKNQSPINIEKLGVTTGARWKIDYKTTSLNISHNEQVQDIIDNGHTIQITVDTGSTFTFENKLYVLKQFHFHTPSEHTIDGKHLPMEMHMVHQAKDGSLAVIAVLFKEGKKPNANLAKIIPNLPNAKGEAKHLQNDSINIKLYMPRDNYAYHYIGSLTTPPCNEDVQWMVLKDMIVVTPDQVKAFSSRIGPNNRPTQPLNGRKLSLDDLKAR